jgi:hypothetical protein
MQEELPLLLVRPGNLLTIGGLASPGAGGTAAGLVGMRLLLGELSRIDARERLTRTGVLLAAFPAELVLRCSCGTPGMLPPPVLVLLLLCVPVAE